MEHALRHDSPADVAQLLSRLVVKQAEIVQIRLIDPSLQTSAASDLLPSLKESVGSGAELLAFSDTEALRVFEVVSWCRLRVVMIEWLFVVTL